MRSAGADVVRRFEAGADFWSDVYGQPGVFADVHRYRLGLALALIDRLGLKPGARVLVVGAGGGHEAVALAERGHRVTAADVARSMTDRTRARAAAAGVAIDVVLADVHCLGLESGAFELVVALGVVPWLADPRAAAAEMGRVLAAGGSWVGTVDNVLRLDRLLDPARGPLAWPARQARRLVAGVAVPRRHSRRAAHALLRAGAMRVEQDVTFGFGPFTLAARPVLPPRLERRINAELTRRAAGGGRIAAATGAQRLIVARKTAP